MTEEFESLIRNVPDFPQPGVQFKDITTLLRHGPAFQQAIEELVAPFRDKHIDIVVGIESRGFILAAPVAYQLGAGFVPIRKPGKLPAETVEVSYTLEYGSNTLQMHLDSFARGTRVLLIDDVLATGGTINAATQLIEQIGGEIVGVAFMVELEFLNGRQHLGSYPVVSLLRY